MLTFLRTIEFGLLTGCLNERFLLLHIFSPSALILQELWQRRKHFFLLSCLKRSSSSNQVLFFHTLFSYNKLTVSFLLGSRWKVKDLTYKISKYPAKLKRSDVDKEIQRAFDVWSEYTDLTFTPRSGQVHIEIRFERGEHGDGDPFDGPGGTLAHAYFPVSIIIVIHSHILVICRNLNNYSGSFS